MAQIGSNTFFRFKKALSEWVEFLFVEMKNFGNRQLWWLHNIVSVFNATELIVYLNVTNMANFIIHFLSQ